MHFIYPEWKSLPIIPSDAAMRELFDSKMDLIDVKEILELGYDCAKGKGRKKFTKDVWKERVRGSK